ncbi:hypothetical protein BL252_25015 [Salmonella enterica]|nr:hypothetical protein [Salmonella enterica]EBR4550639.1 hypothetical protein [Salmonella enterica]
MIELDKNIIFKNAFVSIYIKEMLRRVKPFTINFNGKKLDFNKDVLSYLLFDPFSLEYVSDEEVNRLFSDYYYYMSFLLHSRQYFNFLKSLWKNEGLGLKERKKKLRDEREKVISTYLINIVNKPSLVGYNILDTESDYFLYYEKLNCFFSGLNNEIRSGIDYSRIDSELRSEILRNINIRVCPYCNRQYTDYYYCDGRQKNIASLDHFYPQKKFPLYALTLLNFVPSCANCNGMIKKDRLYPLKFIYVDEPTEKSYFKIVPLSIDGILGGVNEFKLVISKRTMSDSVWSMFFRHNEIYSNHYDDLSLWLKKKRLHNSGYKKHLSAVLGEDITEGELRMMLFGTSGCASDLISKPLSKIKKDILGL